MCGRARCTIRPDGFPRAFHLNSRPVRHLNMDRYRPSYNVAPGFNVPVVRRDDGGASDGVVFHCMKWGLIPSFTKKNEKPDHFKMFNARSESIREKASFRRLLPSNRCLVSVEGFYEWKKDGSKKQPYYIHFKNGRPLVFAALFDSWKNSEGEIIYTFTIITTSSSSSLNWLHDRMPVILGDQESTDRWLIDSSMSNLDKILKPYEEADLVWYPVTPEMGKLSFDGPECINEIQVKREETKTKPISQFFSKKGPPQKPKLENTTDTVKEELKSVEEAEGHLEVENTRTKDKPVEISQLERVKEEPKSQGDFYQSPTKQDDNDEKSDVSLSPKVGHGHGIIMKRDFEEFAAADANKPSAKEIGAPGTSPSPVVKRGKVATDKQQPTLFSYFGKS